MGALSPTAPTNVGHYEAIGQFAGSTDYSAVDSGTPPSYTPTYFDITQATATVQVTDYNGTYDSNFHSATGVATGVNGTTLPNSDFTFTAHVNAGVYTTDTWTFTDPNYASQNGTVTDTINKAPLTVIAQGMSKIYDGVPESSFNWDLFGTVYGSDQLISLMASSGEPGFTGTAVGATNVGSYTITPTIGSLTATNYAFTTFVNGTLDITPATAAITVASYTTIYNGAAHTAIGTATGVNNTSLTGLVLSGTTHTNAGTYTDTWTFTDPSGNYSTQSGTVTDAIRQATATIIVTPYNVTYNGAAHNATGTANAAGLVINSDHTNAGIYTDSWTFTNLNYVSQSGTMQDTINKANAVISVTPYNVTYNNATHNATGSVVGVNGVLNGLSINSAHINAGTYTDSWFFTDSTGNYNNVTGQFADIIGKATATINVTPYNVVYNGASHSATGTATGVNSANLAIDLAINSLHSNAGTYGDSWSFNGGPNYNTASGTMTDRIGQASLTIAPINESMVQGNTVPALTVNYTGFVAGQSVNNLTVKPTISTTATSKSLPGLYAIKVIGAVDPNYTINYNQATMNVTPPVVIGGNFAQFTNVTTTGFLIGGAVNINGATITFNVNYKVTTNGHPGTINVSGELINGKLVNFEAVFTSGVHKGLVYRNCIVAGIFISPTEIAVNFSKVNLSNHPAGPMSFTILQT